MPEEIKDLELRVSQGDAKACLSLARLYRDGTRVERDEAKAVEYFKMGGENGDTECVWSLANLYMFRSKEKNYAEAMKAFIKLHDMGEEMAAFDGLETISGMLASQVVLGVKNAFGAASDVKRGEESLELLRQIYMFVQKHRAKVQTDGVGRNLAVT